MSGNTGTKWSHGKACRAGPPGRGAERRRGASVDLPRIHSADRSRGVREVQRLRRADRAPSGRAPKGGRARGTERVGLARGSRPADSTPASPPTRRTRRRPPRGQAGFAAYGPRSPDPPGSRHFGRYRTSEAPLIRPSRTRATSRTLLHGSRPERSAAASVDTTTCKTPGDSRTRVVVDHLDRSRRVKPGWVARLQPASSVASRSACPVAPISR
jgi:hypothetical protein